MEPKQEYRPLAKEDYKSIKVGDVVQRMLAFVFPIYLNVTDVKDTLIVCGGWEFNRETGLEVDEDIPVPASYISKVLTEDEKQIIKDGGVL